jgi:hypothetical protein
MKKNSLPRVLSENEGFVEGVVEEREYDIWEGRKLE